MKIVFEVVATNMVSGHVFVSQKDVELTDVFSMPRFKREQYAKALLENLKSSGALEPKKVGDVLIVRSAVIVWGNYV